MLAYAVAAAVRVSRCQALCLLGCRDGNVESDRRACEGSEKVTFLGTAPGPGGHVGCILGLCWLTLRHIGGPSWAKRYISRHRAQFRWACWVHIGLFWLTLGHMGGPSWAKRVAFLGTAPTLGYMGGPS